MKMFSDINDCHPDPCLNGGLCIDDVDSFTCQCAQGYEGPTCEMSMYYLTTWNGTLTIAIHTFCRKVMLLSIKVFCCCGK